MKKKSILQLFEDEKCVNICAPMVRYSKLPFRLLVREYGCHVACTPMIIADAFIQSENARRIEFTTNEDDRPLVVQFAANNAYDFATASLLVKNYCDGVNINCGCPQRWAMSKGLGAHLLCDPQLVSDMIHQTRNRVTTDCQDLSISAKIRIHSDIGKTVDFCRQIEHAGADWIAVHARTVEQRCEPIDVEALKIIQQSVKVPIVANGNIWTAKDARQIQQETGVDGVMCARGLLENPALFDKYTSTIDCIKRWLTIALDTGVSLNLLQHHLMYMTIKCISNCDRARLTAETSVAGVLDFFNHNYGISL